MRRHHLRAEIGLPRTSLPLPKPTLRLNRRVQPCWKTSLLCTSMYYSVYEYRTCCHTAVPARSTCMSCFYRKVPLPDLPTSESSSWWWSLVSETLIWLAALPRSVGHDCVLLHMRGSSERQHEGAAIDAESIVGWWPIFHIRLPPPTPNASPAMVAFACSALEYPLTHIQVYLSETF